MHLAHLFASKLPRICYCHNPAEIGIKLGIGSIGASTLTCADNGQCDGTGGFSNRHDVVVVVLVFVRTALCLRSEPKIALY